MGFDILNYFLIFFQKTGFDKIFHILCKETICMKYARRQFAWNVQGDNLRRQFARNMQGDNLHEMCKETICKKCARRQFARNVKTYLLKSIHKNISKCCLLQFLPIMLSVITKTYLYNSDPLKPHFYIVKLGFTGVYIIFLIFAQKHRLWVLVRTASLVRTSSPRRF